MNNYTLVLNLFACLSYVEHKRRKLCATWHLNGKLVHLLYVRSDLLYHKYFPTAKSHLSNLNWVWFHFHMRNIHKALSEVNRRAQGWLEDMYLNCNTFLIYKNYIFNLACLKKDDHKNTCKQSIKTFLRIITMSICQHFSVILL